MLDSNCGTGQASHYAPTDIPLVLEGSSAGSLARWLGLLGDGSGPSSSGLLDLTTRLVLAWIGGEKEMEECVQGAGEAVGSGIQRD